MAGVQKLCRAHIISTLRTVSQRVTVTPRYCGRTRTPSLSTPQLSRAAGTRPVTPTLLPRHTCLHSTMASLKLSDANLAKISSGTAKVTVPTYPRSAPTTKEGVVHVGVGGFHRAHLAVFLHKLMEQHGERNYSICGVGVQPNDAAMRDALAAQDYLYTVIERSAAGSSAHVVGAITNFLLASESRDAVIAKMAHPDTRIVSLTITESGYFYNENTHALLDDHPDIVHDLDPANANTPRTTFGFLFAALARRKAAGIEPFTIMSCDNMQHNGTITRNMLVSFARLRDPAVAEWIEKKGAFPNSMVDRITPRTSEADIAGLKSIFGIDDAWPVVTEPFLQWVVEDQFVGGERPAFEKVGVQVVKKHHDVEMFEKHKLRLLNGSHSAIGYPGWLAGFQYVHEVVEHPQFQTFINRMMHEEVKPLLPTIDGVDIDKYCDTLMERFLNPTIMDQLPRICLGASGKIPQFIMPSIAEAIWVKGPFRRLCFVAAAWFRYLQGVQDNGTKFEIDDPMAGELMMRARKGGVDPRELLAIKELFGEDLRSDERFIKEISTALELITKDGIMKTLPKYLD